MSELYDYWKSRSEGGTTATPVTNNQNDSDLYTYWKTREQASRSGLPTLNKPAQNVATTNVQPVKTPQIAEVPKSKFATYADPSYKMSSAEKKETKQAYKELKKIGIEGNTDSQRQKFKKAIEEGVITPEYADEVMNAYNKSSASGAALSAIVGLGSALTKPITATAALAEQAGNKITGADNSTWKEANNAREAAFNEQTSLNPLATGVGQFAGSMVQYQGLNGLLGEGKNALGNLALGQAADTILDTVPTIGNDLLNGKYANEDGTTNTKELVKDVVKNQGTNLAFNLGAEFLPQISKAVRGDYEVEALKNALNAPNAEVSKEAVKNVNNVVDSAKNLDIKPETVEEVAETATKNAVEDTVNTIADEKPSLPTVGKGNGEDTGYSKMVVNGTLNRNGINTIDDEVGREIASYKIIHEADSLEESIKRLETNEGYDYWNKSFTTGNASIESPTDVDTAMQLLTDKKYKIAELEQYIASGAEDAEEAQQLLSEVTAQKNLIARRLRRISTKNAQALQALAKWNRNADGAVANAQRILDDNAQNWAKKNGNKSNVLKNVADNIAGKVKNSTTSDKLAKAFEAVDNKGVLKASDKPVLTHEDYVARVKNTIDSKFGEVKGQFSDGDIDYLATLLEQNKPTDLIADELNHKLKMGSWYTLDESLPIKQKSNTKTNMALKAMSDTTDEGKVLNDITSDIRAEVKASLEGEAGSVIKDLSDADIDYVTNLVKQGVTSNELADMLKIRAATGKWDIDNSVIDEVNNLFKQAEIYDINSKNRIETENKAFALLADNIYGRGGTFWEKFDQWRFLAMLGNTKTHMRNIISNALFGTVTSVSNSLAAALESGIDNVSKAAGGNGIERTKSLLAPTDAGLVKRAGDDALDASYRQLTGTKYDTNLRNSIESKRKVFKTRLANGISEGNTNALEFEDFVFNKAKYSTSLAGYLKANGYDDTIFDAERNLEQVQDSIKRLRDENAMRLMTDTERANVSSLIRQQEAAADELKKQIEVLNKGREYAVKQAQYSTFHEDNVIAERISKLQREARKSDNVGIRLTGKMIEGVMPFTKTPANILRSGIEYSPLGIIRDAVDLAALAKGNITASQFVENLSKTLTGSGLLLLGMWMKDRDMLTTSSDPVTGEFDKNRGIQGYSIKYNGKTYTIDFAVPSAMPLLVGAEVMDIINNKEGIDKEAFLEAVNNKDFFDAIDALNVSDYVNAIGNIAEPINDTSMLSGINDTIDSIKNNDNVLGSLAANALTGYATQGIPTTLGQVARTIDNTRRSTYAGHDGAVGAVEKQVNKVVNKLPWLSQNNEAYVDLWGREQQNAEGNTLQRAAYQFLSPSYAAEINNTPVDIEIERLYNLDKENNKSVLPKSHAYKIGDERMSEQDRYTYAKKNGETRYKAIENLINTPEYKKLPDAQKAKAIANIYTVAAKVARYAVTKDDSNETDSMYLAYKEGGVKGLNDYLLTKGALDEYGFTMSSTNAVNAFKKTGEEGLRVLKSIKNASGKVSTQSAYDYFQTSNRIPTLDAGKYLYLLDENSKGEHSGAVERAYEKNGYEGVYTYYNILNAADSNNNNSLTRDEIYDYLKELGYSKSEQDAWYKLIKGKED